MQTFEYGYAPTSAAERNRVLRNTYVLLALSMIPTVLGAWIGVATGLTLALSGGLGLVVFLAGAFGFIYAIEKTKESSTGVCVVDHATNFKSTNFTDDHAMLHQRVCPSSSNDTDIVEMARGSEHRGKWRLR